MSIKADYNLLCNHPNIEYLNAKFDETIKITDYCHEWLGAFDQDGYGLFWFDKISYRAHRFSYKRVNPNEDIFDRVIMHNCDNPSCVNPQHLVNGTILENNRDRNAKNINAKYENTALFRINQEIKGEKSHCSKLKEIDVKEIRLLYSAGKMLQPALAKQYGVSQAVISSLILRKTWKHVE
jgi:DNA-binding transcriptional regulator YiaG